MWAWVMILSTVSGQSCIMPTMRPRGSRPGWAAPGGTAVATPGATGTAGAAAGLKMSSADLLAAFSGCLPFPNPKTMTDRLPVVSYVCALFALLGLSLDGVRTGGNSFGGTSRCERCGIIELSACE